MPDHPSRSRSRPPQAVADIPESEIPESEIPEPDVPERDAPAVAPAPTRRSVHYPVDARPAVLVLHSDDCWYPGRLHAWLPGVGPGRPGWHAVVNYLVGRGLQYYLCLPADRVRRAEEDLSETLTAPGVGDSAQPVGNRPI